MIGLTALWVAAAITGAAPVLVDRIVASVETRVVTQGMVDLRVKEGAKSRAEARDALIDALIVRHEADKLQIAITREDLDRALAAVAENNQITVEELTATVRAQGWDVADYREVLRLQLLEGSWVQRSGDVAAKPAAPAEFAAWHAATLRKLIAEARARLAVDVRAGEP